MQDERPRVSGGDVWRLVGPWLGYVFLAAAAVLGLFTASGAGDSATYAVGLATFALAVVIIGVRMNLQLAGRDTGFLLHVSVESTDTLLVAVALLTVLGIVGVILAATIGGTVYTVGLALFAVSVLVIFFEVKRYFDARDHRA